MIILLHEYRCVLTCHDSVHQVAQDVGDVSGAPLIYEDMDGRDTYEFSVAGRLVVDVVPEEDDSTHRSRVEIDGGAWAYAFAAVCANSVESATVSFERWFDRVSERVGGFGFIENGGTATDEVVTLNGAEFELAIHELPDSRAALEIGATLGDLFRAHEAGSTAFPYALGELCEARGADAFVFGIDTTHTWPARAVSRAVPLAHRDYPNLLLADAWLTYIRAEDVALVHELKPVLTKVATLPAGTVLAWPLPALDDPAEWQIRQQQPSVKDFGSGRMDRPWLLE